MKTYYLECFGSDFKNPEMRANPYVGVGTHALVSNKLTSIFFRCWDKTFCRFSAVFPEFEFTCQNIQTLFKKDHQLTEIQI